MEIILSNSYQHLKTFLHQFSLKKKSTKPSIEIQNSVFLLNGDEVDGEGWEDRHLLNQSSFLSLGASEV